MTNLIIKHHRPRLKYLLTTGLVIVLILIGYRLFLAGVHSAGFDLDQVNKERGFWQQKEYQLNEEIRKLQEHNAILQRGGQVESEANKALEKTIAELNEELVELKSELTFYRGIVAPNEVIKGLNIQQFTLSRQASLDSYAFKLVLTQVLKLRSLVYGGVELTISGTMDGKEKEFQGKELGLDPNEKPMLFRFRYFQTIDGEFTLPENFVPSKVTVSLNQQGKRKKKVAKEYDWVVEELK